jgi:hypothetical protein
VLTRAVQKLENLDCLFTQIQQFDVFTQAVESRWCALPHC